MLVAISGSQGSGKSTVLAALKATGFTTIDRKTSRSILSDWNVTLQDVNNDHDLTLKFQQEIIKRKHQDELIAKQTPGLYFTERTYADLFTYALISLGRENTLTDWLDKYYINCMQLQQSYDLVYYLRAGHFTPEHDGVRGSNAHYSRMVDLTMVDITQQMTHQSVLNIIDTPILDQRIAIIKSHTAGIMTRVERRV
jgi:energy-coupling factor transporter ATP-binding protein EcfA2